MLPDSRTNASAPSCGMGFRARRCRRGPVSFPAPIGCCSAATSDRSLVRRRCAKRSNFVINWIVAIVTVFALGFVLLWLLVPGFRARVEQPKFEMLKRVGRLK